MSAHDQSPKRQRRVRPEVAPSSPVVRIAGLGAKKQKPVAHALGSDRGRSR